MVSPEAQIVADGIESGLSIRKTWHNVNWHRRENELEMLSESCVVEAIRRMKPVVKKIKKRKMGSTDPNSDWAIAQKNWCTQLLVRLGEIEMPRPVEKRFCLTEIGKLDLHQIVWWDETHRKCLIGWLSATKNCFIDFPRDKEGRFDVKGEYSQKIILRLNVKYEKECRMGLGCAMVKPLDQNGEELPSEGRRCNLFNYTSKVLISVSDFNKLVKTEIARVRKCSPNSSVWVENRRERGVIYSNECVKVLKQCGDKTRDKLHQVGIDNVGKLKNVPNPNDFELPQGLTRVAFVKLWEQAQESSDASIPPPVDHRKAVHPYISKYGDQWQAKIKKSPTFSNSVCVTDYIEHIINESQLVMNGTRHSDDWFFFHDALSIMTAAETKQWMKEKGYYERWILPSINLYDNYPNLKTKYKGNPLGNSPEFMPWDAHLNSDIHASMDYHCLMSKHLAEDDPKNSHLQHRKKC